MKFAIIALIATVAAETKTLSLGGAAPSPADAKTADPSKDPKENKNITTEKWEMTKDGVTTQYEAQFDNGKKSMCCVNTILHHKASGTKDINYRCMTKAVIDSNVDMKLGDFEVHMNCVGSGAKYLTLGGVAILVASSLY